MYRSKASHDAIECRAYPRGGLQGALAVQQLLGGGLRVGVLLQEAH